MMAVPPEDLLTRWQNLHFDERQSESTARRADILMNIMTQVQCATQSKILDPDASYKLMCQYGSSYAAVLDSPQDQQGLDNFAEGALALAEGKKNESDQWTSSLSIDNIKSTPWGQNLFQANKAALSSMMPPNGENSEIRIEIPKQVTRSAGLGTAQETPAGPVSKPNVTPSVSNGEGKQQRNQNQTFWNLSRQSEPSTSSRQPASSNQSSDNSTKGLFSRQVDHRRDEQSSKRPRETDSDNEENFPSVSAFRTANQQLAIDQQRKYNRGQRPAPPPAYGTNKKSLGTRRGINSRFVPPVLSREDDSDGDNALVKRVTSAVLGPNATCGGNKSRGGASEEVVDERLKNIEPKMIELISSEIMDHGPPISWDDIAGLEFAKKTIKEIVVWPMLRPDIFTGLRGPPKGLLLFGPPGTGKTLIGKCIASQSKSTFFSISASSLTSKWVGEGEKMVRALFAVARVHQPAVIFIDEIDSLLSQRSDSENEASRRIKTEFLVQLDGATTGAEDRILVVGATNRPQEIDEAARRRFVKRLYIPLPESAARRQIVIHLVSQQSHDLNDDQLELIATQTDGYSGSDMANLCREAALGPIRCMAFAEIENISADQVRPITYQDFQDALKQVRASVSEKDLSVYLDWNKQYGSWGIG